jgi:hypothetical protein
MSGKGYFGDKQAATAYSVAQKPYLSHADTGISMMQITSCRLFDDQFYKIQLRSQQQEK